MERKSKVLDENRLINFFGVSFDPCFDPVRVLQKQWAAEAAELGGVQGIFNEPYDNLMSYLEDLLSQPRFQKSGKVFIESWLSPWPDIKDLPFITLDNYVAFIAKGGCRDYADRVTEFVEKEVLEGAPAMIGIDHSCTGGVLEALTKRYGKENITLLVLDAHFDGIPQSIRYEAIQRIKDSIEASSLINHMPDVFSRVYYTPSLIVDSYASGSFLYYLLEEDKVKPSNLKFIGIREYPGKERVEFLRSKGLLEEPSIKKMFEIFNDLEERGTQFITRAQIRREGVERALNLLKEIETPYLYLSVDIDVIAISAIYGSRSLNLAGLTENQLYEVGLTIKKLLEKDGIQLVGFDIMETDPYRAGFKINEREIDRTYQIEANFIRQLLTDLRLEA